MLKFRKNLLQAKSVFGIKKIMSSRFAGALAAKLKIPAVALQHHAAHAAACLGENNWLKPALALCLDGSGLGPDGSIWGGEALLVDLGKPAWQRVGSLAPFPLPGGESAIRQPWRLALGLRWQLGDLPVQPTKKELTLLEMLNKGLNCPTTSSCGRLFDAVASQLGLCDEISYEGQAAIRLEKAALEWLAGNPGKELPDYGAIPINQNGIGRLDTQAFFLKTLRLQAQNLPPGAIAAAFHHAISRNLAMLASQLAGQHNLTHVALTGGVMQNSLLLRLLSRYLRDSGLEPLTHEQAPPGDGGISLGQVIWGRRLVEAGELKTD